MGNSLRTSASLRMTAPWMVIVLGRQRWLRTMSTAMTAPTATVTPVQRTHFLQLIEFPLVSGILTHRTGVSLSGAGTGARLIDSAAALHLKSVTADYKFSRAHGRLGGMRGLEEPDMRNTARTGAHPDTISRRELLEQIAG